MKPFPLYACLLGALLFCGGACKALEGPEGRPGGAETRRPAAAPWPDFALPPDAALCGQPFDLSRRSVYERLEAEFLIAVNHRAQVNLWRRRAQEFFPLIEAELRAAGLPDDLKYLAVAESDLKPWALSPAGALGLWQFMPATARRFGLTVDGRLDGRHSPESSLAAALDYLKRLHAAFGDWRLALAAYNAGEGRIRKAMRGSGDYSELDLPRETERYVYRIAAIKLVLENAAAYGYDETPPLEGYRPVRTVRRTLELPAGSGWTEAARLTGCDYKTLRALNRHILGSSLSGTYELRLPAKD